MNSQDNNKSSENPILFGYTRKEWAEERDLIQLIPFLTELVCNEFNLFNMANSIIQFKTRFNIVNFY